MKELAELDSGEELLGTGGSPARDPNDSLSFPSKDVSITIKEIVSRDWEGLQRIWTDWSFYFISVSSFYPFSSAFLYRI